MDMSYSKNPNLPKVRAEAVKMVRSGQSTRVVARHFGFSQSTIVKWCKKVPPDVHDFRAGIPTESSRPKHHPKELSDESVAHVANCFMSASNKRKPKKLEFSDTCTQLLQLLRPGSSSPKFPAKK